MRLSGIRTARFRGVRILIPEDQTEGGRNVIEHNYPDSNVRWLEDNGRQVDNYRVRGYIPDSEIGALKAALDRPGPGTLNHPWLGRARVAVMGRYQIARTDKHSGYLEVDIPFGRTSGSGLPISIRAIPATVTSLASSGLASAFAQMGARWK